MKTLILILILAASTMAEVCNGTYKDIVSIVSPLGWTVTSTTGGRHNTNSKHYLGKAVDLSVRFKTDLDVMALTETLKKRGYLVRDERIRPLDQVRWFGAHLHVSVPNCVEVVPDDEELPFGIKQNDNL